MLIEAHHILTSPSEEKDLKPVLQSLACGKKKVLRKLPKGPEVNASDVFEFNNDFKDDKIKVHINSIQSKVTVRTKSCLNRRVLIIDLFLGGGIEEDAQCH